MCAAGATCLLGLKATGRYEISVFVTTGRWDPDAARSAQQHRRSRPPRSPWTDRSFSRTAGSSGRMAHVPTTMRLAPTRPAG